jgi:hypothetical protein
MLRVDPRTPRLAERLVRVGRVARHATVSSMHRASSVEKASRPEQARDVRCRPSCHCASLSATPMHRLRHRSAVDPRPARRGHALQRSTVGNSRSAQRSCHAPHKPAHAALVEGSRATEPVETRAIALRIVVHAALSSTSLGGVARTVSTLRFADRIAGPLRVASRHASLAASSSLSLAHPTLSPGLPAQCDACPLQRPGAALGRWQPAVLSRRPVGVRPRGLGDCTCRRQSTIDSCDD